MLNALIKSQLRHMGIDAMRLSPLSNFGLQTAEIIGQGGFDIVFDVGANTGQFACELRENGFAKRIVSVEPLTAAHAALSDRAGKDALWTVIAPCALGAVPGEAEIHIAGNLASSSLLPMNAAHSDAAPYSAYVSTETVAIRTFDDVAGPFLTGGTRGFLKIDTQGFELEVLKGAAQSLPAIHGMLLELSLVELYDGQALWLDVIDWLEQRGFGLHALNQGFVDPASFRTLQVDGIFLRNGNA